MAEIYQSPTLYRNLKNDPVGSITDALIETLGSGNSKLAEMHYSNLGIAIESRGFPGKDIRLAGARLGELSRRASKGENPEIARKATFYASQLPTPQDNRGGRRKNQEDSDSYIPDSPAEKGIIPYGEVAETIVNAVVDGLDEQTPLNEAVLDSLIQAFAYQGEGTQVNIHTIPPEEFANGYRLVASLSSRYLKELATDFAAGGEQLEGLERKLNWK